MKAPRKGFKSALEDRLKGTDFEKYNRPLLANAAAAAKAAAKAAAANAGKPGSAGSVISTGTLGTTTTVTTTGKGVGAAAKVEPSAAAAAASAAAYAAILPPGKPLPKNATIAKALIQKATKAAAAAAAAADLIEKEKAGGSKWREEHEAFLQIASAGKTTATTPTKPPHAAAAAAAMSRSAISSSAAPSATANAAVTTTTAPPSSASSPESVVSLHSIASVAASDPGSVESSESVGGHQVSATTTSAAPAPKLKPLQVGDKVILLDKNGLTGILQFKGPIWGLKKGTWFGVEFHDGPHGRNDGSYNGTHYFYCKENHGLFVRPERVEAVEKQYIVPALPPSATSSIPIADVLSVSSTVPVSTSAISSPTKPQPSLLSHLKAKVVSPKQQVEATSEIASGVGETSQSQSEEQIVRKTTTARTPPKVAVLAPAPAAPSPPKATLVPVKTEVTSTSPKEEPRPISAASTIKSTASTTSAVAKKPSASTVTTAATSTSTGGGTFNKSLVNNLRKKVDAARPSTNLVEQVKAKQAAAAVAGPLHAPVTASATEPGFEEARRRDIARNADFLRVLAGEKTKLAAADEAALPFSGSGQKLGGSTAGTDPTDTGRGGPKRKVVNAMGQLTYAKGVTDSLPEREKRAAAALARINAMQKSAAATEGAASAVGGNSVGAGTVVTNL
jgi:hypothetical protein